MKYPLIACLLLFAGTPWAENPAPDSLRFAVGFGGGFEAGNGLHLGLASGRNAGRIGLGLIYQDQNAEFKYSAGLRFLRILYEGRINDTYAWIGTAMHGHFRDAEEGFLSASGAGVGLALHLGLPFRLEIDSGWDGYYDSAEKGARLQWGPTLNGALVYEWR